MSAPRRARGALSLGRDQHIVLTRWDGERWQNVGKVWLSPIPGVEPPLPDVLRVPASWSNNAHEQVRAAGFKPCGHSALGCSNGGRRCCPECDHATYWRALSSDQEEGAA